MAHISSESRLKIVESYLQQENEADSFYLGDLSQINYLYNQ